uniref:lamina-associated polypeptide 2, isoforms beta/delta/epsilon/gamma-like isoform X2 n=1 Tax=Myxine glutinosa TaxID=7769 RepID=UPI00358EC751
MSLTLDPEGDCVQNDIAQMSDSELVERLRDYGADPGPIVDQHRSFAEDRGNLTKYEFAMKNPKESLLAEFGESLGERLHRSSLRRFVLTHQDAMVRPRRCNSVPPRFKPDEDEVSSNSATKDPWCFPAKSLRRSDYLRRSQDWLKADLDKAGAVPFASAPPQVAVLPLPHPKIAQPGSPSRQDPMQQKKLPSPPNVSPASEEYDYGPLDTAVLQAPLIERAATYSPKSITLAVKKDLKFLEFPKRPEREFDLYRSPTGISATRRPPIRGAAHSDYASPLLSRRVPEMYARPRLTQHDLLRAKTVLVAKQRSVPIWVRVVITVTLLVFILLVYIAMEENFEMPSEILESKGDKRSDPGV